MSKFKWSLAMIVRNCARDLERCLSSIAPYADEIVIVNTGIDENEAGFKETNEVAAGFGAKVFHFPWIEDFAKARQFSFDKCSNNAVMWLDSDDVVESAGVLNQTIRKTLGEDKADCLHLEYLYDFDAAGNCTTVLLRERVVDRRCFEWRAPIHEVLCQTRSARAQKVPPQYGRIKHCHIRDDNGQKGSLTRNLRVLEHHYLPKEAGGLGEYCEERMLFYWGNTLMGLASILLMKDNKEDEKTAHQMLIDAIRKFMEYIPRSGSKPEIQQAYGNASECARIVGKYKEACHLAQQAIDINPDCPTPYWFLAAAHSRAGHDALAENYAILCLERANQFQQEMVSNPKVIFGGAALLAAESRYKQGKFYGVEEFLKIAEKYYGPEAESIAQIKSGMAEHKVRSDMQSAYIHLSREIEKEHGRKGLQKLASIAPRLIQNTPDVLVYLPKERPADKRSIAFLCPNGMPNGWGPELLKTGIGGSEEAVCYLSEQFAKAGWHVEVYAPCKRQVWSGVHWYPVEEYAGMEREGQLDVLVTWRFPNEVMDKGANAKLTYLWLHDMPIHNIWMHDIWNGYDGIFVLSDFHNKAYDFVPLDKKIPSANGIPTERLVPLDKLANENNRFVYASCPLRGLDTVLTWWEQIKKELPDAELDVYYGFHPTLLESAKGSDPFSVAVREKVREIDQLRRQPGVNWKGFVGHEELHAGFAKAGFWLYPSMFPEISCITGMKMQAHGVVPVTVNRAAMVETVKFGTKVEGYEGTVEDQKRWFDAVIHAAKNPPSKEARLKMAEAARAEFSWKKVADQWGGIFEAGLASGKPPRQYERGRMDLIRASA